MLPACLTLLIALHIACDAGEVELDPHACVPAQERRDRTAEATELIELTDQHAAVYAAAKLPGWRLREIVVPWTDDEPAWFLYGPVPGKGSPMATVYRDNLGQWQTTRDDRVEVPQELLILELADLRLGPTGAAERFEANAPDIDIAAVALLREEDCELRWLISGFVRDKDGLTSAFFTGAVTDANGEFEERERSDVPDLP